ncbi:hypothetical protein FNH05_10115 [Amycolatopsis rhizosphaerae]|uniref:Uncharacterized protein n=1 Tax=Amycolatopsis rhizosphaerae TaxID=2053003 RepID=A0A558D1Q7_9PSEU|nr:hypothetical protein [Amycolatopsis rhizosphaerae]TVT54954.1 hypothetical protein FNH05_10115 [Amycolatopsis rhizosphaerae]
MNSEQELFTRALGTDEPPLRLDVDALADANLRRRRPHPALSLAGTAAAVAIVIGGTVLLTSHNATSPSRAGSPGAAVGTPEIKVEPPTRRDIAYCYRTADISSQEPNQHVPIGINGKGKDGRGDVAADAMQICSTAWQENYYNWQRRPAASQGQYRFAIPALVSCVLDPDAVGVESGAVGVFPGDTATCAGMGLSVAQLP